MCHESDVCESDVFSLKEIVNPYCKCFLSLLDLLSLLGFFSHFGFFGLEVSKFAVC